LYHIAAKGAHTFAELTGAKQARKKVKRVLGPVRTESKEAYARESGGRQPLERSGEDAAKK
jgi:hypothetical protein